MFEHYAEVLLSIGLPRNRLSIFFVKRNEPNESIVDILFEERRMPVVCEYEFPSFSPVVTIAFVSSTLRRDNVLHSPRKYERAANKTVLIPEHHLSTL